MKTTTKASADSTVGKKSASKLMVTVEGSVVIFYFTVCRVKYLIFIRCYCILDAIISSY